MNKTFYFIREFGSIMDEGKISKVLGALLSIFVFIVLIYFLLLPREQPVQTSKTMKSFPPGHESLAQIESGLSSSSINDLYLSLRRLQSVENLVLVLSEEVQAGLIDVPPEMSSSSDLFLIKTSDRQQLLDDLKTQPKIEMVSTLSSGDQQQESIPFTNWTRLGALLIGLLLAGLTFFLLRAASKDILNSWGGELQMVKYSGLSRFSVKFPLVLMGTLVGFLGSALSVLVLLGFSFWAKGGLWLGGKLPTFSDNLSLLIITAWSLVLGSVLGFLASLSTTRAVDKKWEFPEE